jgi:ubiquinone/menaquinone biosynthesis C-methylase UbiE
MIPWRVKNFISEHFPLLFHLVANAGLRGNSNEHWNRRLAETWDSASRWPTKRGLISAATAQTDVILDIGCGNGSILRQLKQQGYTNLHGLEISDYAIQRLQSEGIEMHRGALPSIPLPDATFDVVIASQVLEHVIRRRRFLKELRRVMKPGAQAFIFVPDNCLGPISEPEHVIKFNADSLRKLLARYFCIARLTSIREPSYEAPILFAHVTRATGVPTRIPPSAASSAS